LTQGISGLLQGSTALVTGAGRGIGRGIVSELADAGADLVLLSRNRDELEQAADGARAAGRKVTTGVADIRDPDAVQSVLQLGRENHEAIDILVNNAGVNGEFMKFWEYDEAGYRETVDTNLTGTFIVSQLVARYWREQSIAGRMVNIASVESEIAYPDQAPYAATKGGILTMTKVLARELAEHGIRINAIGPGPIETPLSEQFRELSEAGTAMHRLGDVTEIGAAVVFLCSRMSSYMTGTIVYVDGGYMLK
jgi:NAD(P)-dependent dehydrogenase (short-subunit alcohol dehydrogenase family)